MSGAYTLDQLERVLAFGITERMQPDHDQEPWSQVAEGTLSVEQAVAQAQALHPEASLEELRWRAELFAPPSEDERARQLECALALRFAADPAQPPSRTRSRSRKLWGAAAGLAAAASLTLVFLPSQAEPLPHYDSEWTSYPGSKLGHQEPTAASCRARLHRSLPLQVGLRPTTAVTRPVGVVSWAEPAAGESVALPLDVEVNDHGFIRASAPMDALGLRSGPWQVTFVIGEPDRLAQARELAALPASERPDVVVLRDIVCVVE